MGSLTTCDPGDIFDTIEECKKLKLRTSIIGLAAEVHICKRICEETEGIYNVILDEVHLNDLLQKIAFPLPNSVIKFEIKYSSLKLFHSIFILTIIKDPGAQTLIRMGFPQHKICNKDEVSMCMW